MSAQSLEPRCAACGVLARDGVLRQEDGDGWYCARHAAGRCVACEEAIPRGSCLCPQCGADLCACQGKEGKRA